MSCGCIKEKYTPHIESISPNLMLYKDFSVWMEGGEFTNDSTYNLEIYCPYFESYEKLLNINSKSGVSITPENLGFDDNFKDDIYCFKIDSCGKIYEKSLFFYGNSQCVIDNLIAQNDDTYKELELLLNRVRVNVERENLLQAEDFLKVLKEKIKNIDCGNCP